MNASFDPDYLASLAQISEPIVGEPSAWATNAEKPRPDLKIVSADTLARMPPPDRRWLVPGMIPMARTTLLYGNGGDGKSLLAIQLAVAVASGTDWIGRLPEAGGVLLLSCEDDVDEVHRRQTDIIAGRGDIDINSLSNLQIIDLAGQDAILAFPDKRGTKVETSPLFAEISRLVEVHRPILLTIDTLADVYGGDENVRSQVRQFLGFLNRLAIQFDMAVVVLAHPSLSGMSSGMGSGGSTAWTNSVRSRLYLAPVKTEDGSVPHPALKTLTVMKANYGPAGNSIPLRWDRGRFVLAGSNAKKAASSAEVDQLFLDLLEQFNKEGRNVSVNPSVTYAPAVFAKHADGQGNKQAAFRSAMDRLLKSGKIKNVQFGPPSKPRSKLEIVIHELEIGD